MSQHRVLLPTPYRLLAGGEPAVLVDGDTVGEVLANLVAAHPEFQSRLFDGTRLRRSVLVVVRDRDIRSLQGTATALSEGEELRMLLAFAGG